MCLIILDLIDELLNPDVFVDELAPFVLQVVTVLHLLHDLKHLGPAHGVVALTCSAMISAGAGQPALALAMT